MSLALITAAPEQQVDLGGALSRVLAGEPCSLRSYACFVDSPAVEEVIRLVAKVMGHLIEEQLATAPAEGIPGENRF